MTTATCTHALHSHIHTRTVYKYNAQNRHTCITGKTTAICTALLRSCSSMYTVLDEVRCVIGPTVIYIHPHADVRSRSVYPTRMHCVYTYAYRNHTHHIRHRHIHTHTEIIHITYVTDIPAAGHCRDQRSLCRKLADSAIAKVGDVRVAGRRERDAAGQGEARACGSAVAARRNCQAIRMHMHHHQGSQCSRDIVGRPVAAAG